MITIYRKTVGSSESVRKVIRWMQAYRLDFELKALSNITKSELLELLQNSPNGFRDLLVVRGNEARYASFLDMKTSELLDYCLEHPDILREPICIERQKILVGYHAEEIRKFLPRVFRNGGQT